MDHRYVDWLRKIAGVWGVVAAAIWTCPAAGEALALGSLPGKPGVAGFVMTVDMEATAGNGYQPMSLTFTPLGKGFQQDRHLEVIVEPNGLGQTSLDYQYRRTLTIPQGSIGFRLPLYVPHYFRWESVRVSLREDGKTIETANREFPLPAGVRSRDADQITLVGVLSGDESAAGGRAWERFPDVRTLITVLGNGPLPEDASVHQLSHDDARKLAASVQPASVQFRPFDENHLHDNWLGYSQLDIILVPAPLLERIEANQPERFQQLLSWLAAGGSLWVHAASDALPDSFLDRLSLKDFDHGRTHLINGIQVNPDLTGENDNSNLIYEWGNVMKETSHFSRRGNYKLKPRQKIYDDLKKENHPFARSVDPSIVMDGVSTCSFGLGTVLTIDSADPYPGAFQFWNTIHQCQEDGQTNWRQRMGIDVPKGNANYWMWLIPSVGQPPVKSFVMLNTLFVILIGPICYWGLRKRKRLYFLYFVAPALAMLVTASLFAYAIGSDGTTTKTRTRQLTWIDSAHGYRVEQSRQTYYAVFGSGGGIEVSSDTAIFPVRHTPAINRYYRRNEGSGRLGDLLVREDRQVMGGSFLPPRDQVQYLSMRPIPGEPGIAFQFAPDGGSVSNGLAVSIRRLLVCDSEGGNWEADEVRAGDTVPLRRAAADRVHQLLGPNVLPPLGEVPMLRDNVVRLGGGMAGLQVSQLERRLELWSKRLPEGTFVAIADLDEDRIGIEGGRVMDSVHVVMGELP